MKKQLKFDGMRLELLARIYQDKYQKLTTINEKFQNIIYYELWKDLYGTLDVSLPIWVKLRTDLKILGLKTNGYEWCVMNKYV